MEVKMCEDNNKYTMPESDFNELVHYVSDFLEDYGPPTDRIWINHKLSEITNELGIRLIDDMSPGKKVQND